MKRQSDLRKNNQRAKQQEIEDCKWELVLHTLVQQPTASTAVNTWNEIDFVTSSASKVPFTTATVSRPVF